MKRVLSAIGHAIYRCLARQLPSTVRGGKTEPGNLVTDADKDCYLALTKDDSRIIRMEETLREALEAAQQNGVDDPVVVWSPEDWHHIP